MRIHDPVKLEFQIVDTRKSILTFTSGCGKPFHQLMNDAVSEAIRLITIDVALLFRYMDVGVVPGTSVNAQIVNVFRGLLHDKEVSQQIEIHKKELRGFRYVIEKSGESNMVIYSVKKYLINSDKGLRLIGSSSDVILPGEKIFINGEMLVGEDGLKLVLTD